MNARAWQPVLWTNARGAVAVLVLQALLELLAMLNGWFLVRLLCTQYARSRRIVYVVGLLAVALDSTL